MIKRIVKLTFHKDKVDSFLTIFENSKEKIASFEGCQHLELWREKAGGEVFFTCSFWEDEAALNAYRHSDLFKAVWPETKALFSDKPEAWTVEVAWAS
jgi:heme-degrading monooxygenase HmoA